MPGGGRELPAGKMLAALPFKNIQNKN